MQFNRIHSLVFILIYINYASCKLDHPVDLTWPLDEKSVYKPNSRSFIFTKKVTELSDDGNWYAMNEFCSGGQGGTHFDAPYHFSRNGMKIGDVPLGRLIAPGICINLEAKVKKHGRNATLTTDDIMNWEDTHGVILHGMIVMVNFGWGRYYHSEHYLYNFKGQLSHPGIAKDAAQYLVYRGVYGVGLDTAGVDPPASSDNQSHRVFSSNDIYVVANVRFVVDLPPIGFKLFVLPIKINEGTGGPVRIIAMPDYILQLPKSDFYDKGGGWLKHSWIILSTFLILAMYLIHSFSL